MQMHAKHTWQVRFGAAGGEGAGDTEDDKLAAAGQFCQVHLFVWRPLEEIDGGDGVSGLDGSHAGRVEGAVGDGRAGVSGHDSLKICLQGRNVIVVSYGEKRS